MGHEEELVWNAVMRSAVPQDLVGQKKVHGCEGSCEVTSTRIPDRPAADLDVVLHQDMFLILVQRAVQIPPVESFPFAPGSSFSVTSYSVTLTSVFLLLLPQKEDVHMGTCCCTCIKVRTCRWPDRQWQVGASCILLFYNQV